MCKIFEGPGHNQASSSWMVLLVLLVFEQETEQKE